MPRRAWARSASQTAVAGIGVGVAAYIGWNDYPAVPGNATVVAIGLGWSAVGSAVGAALWPIAGGGVSKLGAFVERLFQVDNRLPGVIKDKLTAVHSMSSRQRPRLAGEDDDFDDVRFAPLLMAQLVAAGDHEAANVLAVARDLAARGERPTARSIQAELAVRHTAAGDRTGPQRWRVDKAWTRVRQAARA